MKLGRRGRTDETGSKLAASATRNAGPPDKIARDIDDGRITREHAAEHHGFSTGSGGGRES